MSKKPIIKSIDCPTTTVMIQKPDGSPQAVKVVDTKACGELVEAFAEKMPSSYVCATPVKLENPSVPSLTLLITCNPQEKTAHTAPAETCPAPAIVHSVPKCPTPNCSGKNVDENGHLQLTTCEATCDENGLIINQKCRSYDKYPEPEDHSD